MTYSIIQKSQLEGALRLDAEYYQLEYLDLVSKIKSQKSKLLKDIAFITDGIHASIDYNKNSGLKCFSAQSVNENYFNGVENYISERQHKENLRTSLKKGDILLSSVGTIGNAAVINEDLLPANADRHVAIIRLGDKTVSPFYLSAFLNSKYGKFQSIRESTGNVQLNLFIDKIKNFIIPIPNSEEMGWINEQIKQGLDELEKSKSLYSQAENLILEELGLKDFQIEDDLSFIVNLFDIKSAHRADAEYFQPKYEKLISKIKTKNAKLLGELVFLKKGIEPGSEEYQEEGKLFIRVSSLSKYGIEDKDQKYLSSELYQKLKGNFEPKVGEILLTKDATPGIAYLLKEPVEGIISGGILRLRVKENIDAEYLTLCINSVIGQMQAERDAGGSVIAHWKPEQIKKILVPILPKPVQQKIADLVRKSHEARKKSKELLEEAKMKVEQMIEKGRLH